MGKTRNLFKKIRDTNRTFPKMGTIKDRNGMDLREAEEVFKKDWQCQRMFKLLHNCTHFTC